MKKKIIDIVNRELENFSEDAFYNVSMDTTEIKLQGYFKEDTLHDSFTNGYGLLRDNRDDGGFRENTKSVDGVLITIVYT